MPEDSFRTVVISGVAFWTDESLPLLYPVVRPGESGVELSGDYELSEWSRVSAGVSWLERNALSPGRSFRSNGAYVRSFGADRPTVVLRWDYNDIIYQFLGDSSEVATFGNRYSVEARQRGLRDSYSVVLQRSDDDRGERSQLAGSIERLVGARNRIDAYALVQMNEHDDVGLIAETTLERELSAVWSYRLGVGATVLWEDVERADGVVTLGVARKLPRRGWYGRVDVTIPFDVGLPRSNRVSQRVRGAIGLSYDWDELSELRRLVAPILDRNAFGSIEGIVATSDGEPIAGATIVVNGSRRSTSDQAGRFAIDRVPVGRASVSVDAFSIDPSLTLTENAVDVMIESRGTASVTLTAKRAVALFGSVVRCVDGTIRAVAGLEMALISSEAAYVVVTTDSGSFALEGIRPGEYELVINPGGTIAAEEIPGITIDLNDDVLGRVIRLGCGDGTE